MARLFCTLESRNSRHHKRHTYRCHGQYCPSNLPALRLKRIDETVLFFLQVSLPDDLSTLHEDTERQVREFFQAFEIQVEAAYVDAVALAVAASPSQSAYRSPNGSRSRSGTQTQDKRSLSISSPGYGARQHNDQSRIESTMMYSYTYNPSEQGKEVEIRPINGLWTAIFPFAVPVCKLRGMNVIFHAVLPQCLANIWFQLANSLCKDQEHQHRPNVKRTRVAPPDGSNSSRISACG